MVLRATGNCFRISTPSPAPLLQPSVRHLSTVNSVLGLPVLVVPYKSPFLQQSTCLQRKTRYRMKQTFTCKTVTMEEAKARQVQEIDPCSDSPLRVREDPRLRCCCGCVPCAFERAPASRCPACSLPVLHQPPLQAKNCSSAAFCAALFLIATVYQSSQPQLFAAPEAFKMPDQVSIRIVVATQRLLHADSSGTACLTPTLNHTP